MYVAWGLREAPLFAKDLCHIHTQICTFQSFFQQIWSCFTSEAPSEGPSKAPSKGPSEASTETPWIGPLLGTSLLYITGKQYAGRGTCSSFLIYDRNSSVIYARNLVCYTQMYLSVVYMYMNNFIIVTCILHLVTVSVCRWAQVPWTNLTTWYFWKVTRFSTPHAFNVGYPGKT